MQEDVLPDFWDIPGGTLEDGEDPAEGAVRETKEETGIEISNPRLFFCRSKIDVEKNKQFVTLIFWARYANQEIILNHKEHQEYAWIKLSDISRYKTVEYLKDCLAAFQEQFGNYNK
jgi:8-oxo-dGTP diphosphatase